MNGSFNQQIAEPLREAADLLEGQAANPFRIRAYRDSAEVISPLDKSLDTIFHDGGVGALEDLPHIGPALAAAIAEMIRTGRWAQLERLRGASEPERLFRMIPGVGPELAHRFCEHLHADTFEALETAAHDGRLERVPGVGPRRAALLRAALGSMLARTRPPKPVSMAEPSVELLLDVDNEYRERAAAGELQTIAPRRFNPRGEAWLPGGTSFTLAWG
jgi:putative hydrolase